MDGATALIKESTDLPSGVIGFETAGKLHAEEYRDVLLPAIERTAAEGDVRCVIVVDDFEGLSAGALWQDLKTDAITVRRQAL